ncbi:hypothetical protein BC830DRAFT_223298 [Chytriomyces sp. MP71]|nr:hypothetical protein BC830DRAFT_223298 [Chytriomyces sp. MP71]
MQTRDGQGHHFCCFACKPFPPASPLPSFSRPVSTYFRGETTNKREKRRQKTAAFRVEMTGTTEGSSSGVAAVSSQQSSDDDADDFCHALVLSLREMSVAENGFCGKLRPNADYAIALAIERDEAKAFIDSVALSRSLQHQDPIPTELLTAFEDEDARETRDREFAVRVSRGGTLPPMQFKFAPGALESFAVE